MRASHALNAGTRFIALLGWPVEHSLSPHIHNAALEAQRLNVRYGAFSVAPRDLESAVRGLAALRFLGANVTLPHKAAVLSFMDEVTPGARAVGAVNTIVCRHAADGRAHLLGDNTDIEGFLSPIEPQIAVLRGGCVVVLGSGGAARAVVYGVAIRLRPSRLTIVARTPAKAERMVEEVLAGAPDVQAIDVVPQEEGAAAIRDARLVVNATPAGMHPDVDATPWADETDLRPGQLVYDLVYNPRETRFLRMARSRGADVVDGLEMLIAQAVASYRQWTEREMPVEVVRKALAGYPV